jgi:hypothetical protein
VPLKHSDAQQPGAPPLADLVADGVADDSGGYHDDREQHDGHPTHGGDEAAEQDRALAGITKSRRTAASRNTSAATAESTTAAGTCRRLYSKPVMFHARAAT